MLNFMDITSLLCFGILAPIYASLDIVFKFCKLNIYLHKTYYFLSCFFHPTLHLNDSSKLMHIALVCLFSLLDFVNMAWYSAETNFPRFQL